jgi:hypothetical protein
MFRFIDIENGRTVGEFIAREERHVFLRSSIGNRELLAMHGAASGPVRMEDVDVMVTTDRGAHIRCFLLLPRPEHVLDTALLQVIVDQAQILYPYLQHTSSSMSASRPVFMPHATLGTGNEIA